MRQGTRKGRRPPAKKIAGPGNSPSRGAVARQSTTAARANALAAYDPHTAAELARLVYDMAHPDPGPLCHRCLRPYREWRDVPPCECGDE